MTILPSPGDPRFVRALRAVMSAQRPAVLAHIRSIRRLYPAATPDQIVRILERRYLAGVTASGAGVGAAAVIPAVGVGASLALSGVETVAFLEGTALFAQSITEVHGIAVSDPDRAHNLVMALMLGGAGRELVEQFTAQATGAGPTRSAYWGQVVTTSLPRGMTTLLGDKLRSAFVRRFTLTQGSTIIGRAIPFGIGAVIGGTGNHLIGRKVVGAAREAFGPAPALWPDDLLLTVRPEKVITAKPEREPGNRSRPRIRGEQWGKLVVPRLRWEKQGEQPPPGELENSTPPPSTSETSAPSAPLGEAEGEDMGENDQR